MPFAASLLAFALGTSGVGSPAAYPIPPVPLRALVDEAALIVVAKVASVDRDGGYAWAHLDIERCLKGEPPAEVIVESFEAVICPQPARYEADTTVLAFLEPFRGPPLYTTCSLSYGVKKLEPEALALFSSRVEELVALRAEQRRLETVAPTPTAEAALLHARELEWIVRCAIEPATRWDGAYEFCREWPDYESDPVDECTPLAAELRPEQRTRLRDALVAAPTLGAGERCLESLLASDRDPRVFEWLADRCREATTPKSGATRRMIRHLLQRMARMRPSVEFDRLIEEYGR